MCTHIHLIYRVRAYVHNPSVRPDPTMPRDLFAPNQEEGMTESPDAQTPKAGAPVESNGHNEFTIHRIETDQTGGLKSWKTAERRNVLHPYVQTLSIADVDSCEMLESVCFPEEERCTREKVCVSISAQYHVPEVNFSAVCAWRGTVMFIKMIFRDSRAPRDASAYCLCFRCCYQKALC